MNDFVVHLTDKQIAILEEMVGIKIEDELDLEYALRAIIDFWS